MENCRTNEEHLSLAKGEVILVDEESLTDGEPQVRFIAFIYLFKLYVRLIDYDFSANTKCCHTNHTQ